MPGYLPDDVTQARIDRELEPERDVVDDEKLGQPAWLRGELPTLTPAEAEAIRRMTLRMGVDAPFVDCPVAPIIEDTLTPAEAEALRVPPDLAMECVACGDETPMGEVFDGMCRACQREWAGKGA